MTKSRILTMLPVMIFAVAVVGCFTVTTNVNLSVNVGGTSQPVTSAPKPDCPPCTTQNNPPPTQPTKGNFEVFRHINSPEMTDDQAKQIITEGVSVLSTDDDGAGSADVACPIQLGLKGSVQTFNIGTGSVDSSADMEALLSRPGNSAYVVNEINYCGGPPNPGFHIIGCASTGTPIVVVAQDDFHIAGILWVHEYGHTKGLPHRTDDERAVMYPSIGLNRRMVIQDECDHYHSSSLQQIPGGQHHPQPLQATGKPGAQKMPIREFVKQQYIEGVPYEEASRYGADDVPVLLDLLKNPPQDVYVPTVVGVLGVIGDARGIDPLITFIETGEGKLTRQTYGAKKGAVLALGQTANKVNAPKAVDYLKASLDPATWDGRIKWELPYPAPKSTRNWQMVKASVWGLAMTGKPEARDALQRLLQQAEGGGSDVPADVANVVRDALKTHSEVREGSLGKMYELHRR